MGHFLVQAHRSSRNWANSMLAEVFFLSSRGDVLASRHYRCIGENSSPDAFFSEIRSVA